jgi:hypothetical protein
VLAFYTHLGALLCGVLTVPFREPNLSWSEANRQSPVPRHNEECVSYFSIRTSRTPEEGAHSLSWPNGLLLLFFFFYPNAHKQRRTYKGCSTVLVTAGQRPAETGPARLFE